MAISYVAQKCTSCAGTKFRFIEKVNMWECQYCGALIERHEKVDSMFTIKNVVRQTILDAAYDRLDGAKRNLTECQKIDPKYIGTITAEMVYYTYVMKNSKNIAESRNASATVIRDRDKIKEFGAKATEEEIALFDSLESSEVVGVLILVYDLVKLYPRRDHLLGIFNASEVYSIALNMQLLAFALKTNNLEMAGTILDNEDNIEKRSALHTLLEFSGTFPEKGKRAASIIKGMEDIEEADKKYLESYLENTNDDEYIRLAVTEAFCLRGVRPQMDIVMRRVVSVLTDASMITGLMETLINSSDLVDSEISIIVDYSVERSTDDICLTILDMLKKKGVYVALTRTHFINALIRQNSTVEKRKEIVSSMMMFDVTDKTKDSFISDYLCLCADVPDVRAELIDHIFSFVKTLTTSTIEKYLVTCVFDEDQKPAIVKKIFSLEINKAFLNHTLFKYVMESNDKFEIKSQVINILLDAGLKISAKEVSAMLLLGRGGVEQKVELINKASLTPGDYSMCLSEYTRNAGSSFQPEIFTRLLSGASAVDKNTIIHYVLAVRDLPESKSGNIGRMMSGSAMPASQIICDILVGGDKVTCSLAQAYLLITQDPVDCSVSVIDKLGSDKSSLNSNISVSGKNVKFKKYIAAKRKEGSLGQVSEELCRYCKLI